MKISHRLALSMAAMAVLSVFLLAGLIYNSTSNIFSRYIDRSISVQCQHWAGSLTAYYAARGSWDGLQSYLQSSTGDIAVPGHHFRGRGLGMSSQRYLMGSEVVVVDASHQVVGDSNGTRLGRTLSSKDWQNAYPLLIDNMYIGSVIFFNAGVSRLGDLEVDFLHNMSRATLLAALLTLIIAILAAIFISHKISHPISDLVRATNQLAEGRWQTRAPVGGDQEFAVLADNFNLMAQKLEEAQNRRENMTADIIHELKTPLSILRGNLESLQSGALNPSEETYLSLQDEVIRLSKLVDDLEVLSRVESGRLALNLKACELPPLLDALFPIINTLELQGKNFSSEIADDVPALYVDKDRILQVLINLLSNAMAYTPEGGTIKLAAGKGEGGFVHIAISDSGKGIEEQDLEHIFDRFYRAERSRSRRLGGTGLGLAIARGFVEAHQGKIWAESTPGQGSTFHLLLPAA
ncbi:HAMP domain-containing sensor histidine kinase [Syntrophomonas curvata]